MASIREIQGRIKSIEDTKKITNAMYLISSTKLRKARKDQENTSPYFAAVRTMISRIFHDLPDLESRYVQKPGFSGGNKCGFLVITADKGLAGSYNHNVLKLASKHLNDAKEPLLFVVGEVGRQYFRSRKIPVEQSFLYTAQNPNLDRAREIAGKLVEHYENGDIDEICIVYTKMKNSLAMETEFARLLPLSKDAFETPEDAPQTLSSQTFEPSAEAAIQSIVPNYLTGFVYGALVESFCCEQNARMMAMSAANDNAEEILRELNIQFNRVRQAIITQEITEVIGGAKALKSKGDAI